MLNWRKLMRVIMVLAVIVGLSGVLPLVDVAASPGYVMIYVNVYGGDLSHPLLGATVRVEDYDTGDVRASGATDSNGLFVTALDDVDTYRIRATAPGFASEWYDSSYHKDEAAEVSVTAGMTIDIVLSQASTISGNVQCQRDWGLETWENISVIAHPADGSPYGFSAPTDHQGNYTIEGVPYGDYKVSASGRGPYAPNPDIERWMTQWYDGRDSFDTADVVPVGTAPVTSISFVLQEGGEIQGSVRDQDGESFGVATVFVQDWGSGELIVQVETNEYGDFQVRGLASGDYLVSATAEGRELKYYENTSSREEAQPVHLSAPDSYHCWFNLGPGGSFSGTVFNADGSATIAEAQVVAQDSTSGKYIRAIKAGADGTYTFSGLAQGFYKVWASAPGFVREYYDGADGVPDFENANIVSVAAGQNMLNINFKLDLGGTISGTVTDVGTGDPLANISVGIAAATSGDGVPYLSFVAVTNSDGQYTIDGLPFGSYKVYATGTWGGSNSRYMQKWYNQMESWEEAGLVTVGTSTPAATGKDFALEKGGAIRGNLTRAEDGNPVTWGGWVMVYNYTTEFPLQFVTDGDVRDDGSYIVEGLPTGDYLVVAGAEQRASMFYQDAYDLGDATAVHVDAPGDTIGKNFSLEEGGYIQGDVWNWYGERLANFPVMAERQDDGARFLSHTDEDGYYQMCVPFGSYKVVALGGDFYPDDPWYVTQWYDYQWSEEDAREMKIGDDWEAEEQMNWWAGFNLPRGGAVSGYIYDADTGIPIAGAWLDAHRYHDWQYIGSAETDAEGYYRLLVQADDLRLEAGAEGYVSEFYQETTDPNQANMLHVDEGIETGGIEFNLEAGGVISGTTYEATGQTALPWVMVAATPASNPQAYYSTISDENGNYELSVPYGDYNVMAQGSEEEGGDPRYATEWYSETTSWEDADIVSISAIAPSQSGIDFTLELGGSISGTVKDEWTNTVWDAEIIVRDAQTGMFAGSAWIDGDGTYTVSGLASGDYQVTAFANGRSRVFYDNKTDWEGADIVTVTAPDDTGPINFELMWANGTISGDIIYSGQVPDPESHQVFIFAMDMRMMEMETQAPDYWVELQGPGHYQIDNVGEGSYLLVALLDADDSGMPSQGDPYGFYGELTPVTITKTEDPPDSGNWQWDWKAGIDIQVTDGEKGFVTGQVEMELRDDYSGATITVGTETTTSGVEGYYSVTVAPGTYDVTISMDGYLTATMPDVEVYEMLQVGLTELPTVSLIIGDTNDDEAIDSHDLALVASVINTAPPGDDPADLNDDQIVDIYDLVLIGKSFGKTES